MSHDGRTELNAAEIRPHKSPQIKPIQPLLQTANSEKTTAPAEVCIHPVVALILVGIYGGVGLAGS